MKNKDGSYQLGSISEEMASAELRAMERLGLKGWREMPPRWRALYVQHEVLSAIASLDKGQAPDLLLELACRALDASVDAEMDERKGVR